MEPHKISHAIGNKAFQSLEQLLHAISPSLVETTGSVELRAVNDSDIIVFIKKITGDIGVFNDMVAKNTFGPDLIHRDDYTKIQMYMSRSEYRRCIYVIHSTATGFHYQTMLPLDDMYIKWLGVK